MRVEVFAKTLKYDGTQIESLWANSKGIPGDSIVLFRGSMDIPDTNIKDLEDLLDNKAIKGGDMLHFIVERFDSPASIRLAYYMQRMLIVCARDVLEQYDITSVRNGDDLFVDGGKLTVSIATAGISSEKIHMGINISCRGTPPDVKVACLENMGIKDIMGLGEEIARNFISEIEDIESDIVKTKTI